MRFVCIRKQVLKSLTKMKKNTSWFVGCKEDKSDNRNTKMLIYYVSVPPALYSVDR